MKRWKLFLLEIKNTALNRNEEGNLNSLGQCKLFQWCSRWTKNLQNVICQQGWDRRGVLVYRPQYWKKSNVSESRQHEHFNLLLMSTWSAWLSGGPASKWYGMTVVKYLGSIEDVLRPFGRAVPFWPFNDCVEDVIDDCILPFFFFSTWNWRLLFWTANKSEINVFFNSFSYSNSSRSASSEISVSENSRIRTSISM